MATGVTNRFKFEAAAGTSGAGISIPASTWKAMLYSTGWLDVGTARLDQDFVLVAPNSSLSLHAHLLSTAGAGYDHVTIGARSITQNNTADRAEVDAADVTFANVASSAENTNGKAAGMALVVELQVANSSGRYLASFYDFSSAVTLNGGNVLVSLSTGGFLQLLTSTSDASP